MHVWFAVRYDHKSTVSQLRPHMVPEPLLGPELFLLTSDRCLLRNHLSGYPQVQGDLFDLAGQLSEVPGFADGGVLVGAPR